MKKIALIVALVIAVAMLFVPAALACTPTPTPTPTQTCTPTPTPTPTHHAKPKPKATHHAVARALMFTGPNLLLIYWIGAGLIAAGLIGWIGLRRLENRD